MSGRSRSPGRWLSVGVMSALVPLVPLVPLLAIPVAGFCRAPQSLDVRLVVDVSARMADADPEGFRSEAAELLIQLLPAGSKAGVWTYSRYVNMLVKHDSVEGHWKESARLQVKALPAVGPDADLLGALDAATWDRGIAGTGRMRHLLLLSDGRLQTGGGVDADLEARHLLLGARLSELVDAGFILHVLQLPGAEEDGLLRQMAHATGGTHSPVADLHDLSAKLLSFFNGVAQPQSLPVVESSFEVDPGIAEMTVLRPKAGAEQDLALVDPNGVALTRARLREGVRWQDAGRYDMVTIQRPIPGRWHFSGASKPGVRVLVLGDIELRLSGIPSTVFPGMLKTVELELRSSGASVVDEEFLELLKIRAVVVGAQEEVPVVVEFLSPGHYLLKLLAFEEQGEYTVRIGVSGPTFSRELHAAFLVRNPVALRIVPAGDGALAWLELNMANVDFQSLEISARVNQPPAAAMSVPIDAMPAGLWKIRIPETRGAVELTLDIAGNYLNGSPFKLETDPIVLPMPCRFRTRNGLLAPLPTRLCRQLGSAFPSGS